jgi:hypothetical protein
MQLMLLYEKLAESAVGSEASSSTLEADAIASTTCSIDAVAASQAAKSSANSLHLAATLHGYVSVGGHAEFTIETTFYSVSGTTWTSNVRRRYSDFTKLHAQLALPLGLPPKFSAPKACINTRAVNESRIILFERYLNYACNEATASVNVAATAALCDFLAGPPTPNLNQSPRETTGASSLWLSDAVTD